MLVLVVVLAATNVITLAAFAWLYLRPAEQPAPDRRLAASLDGSVRAAPTSSTRRIITVEVLNPIELAGSRGRIAGIAGSLAPGITRRVVYDQVLARLRRQLADENVAADVRLHIMRPGPDGIRSAEGVDAGATAVPPDGPDHAGARRSEGSTAQRARPPTGFCG
jgi:hypothetical protein